MGWEREVKRTLVMGDMALITINIVLEINNSSSADRKEGTSDLKLLSEFCQ